MARYFRKIKSSPRSDVVYRTAVHHFDLVKSGMADGVSSSTNLFDDVEYDMSNLRVKSDENSVNPFSIHLDKMDLADRLMNDRSIGKKSVDSGLSTGPVDPSTVTTETSE